MKTLTKLVLVGTMILSVSALSCKNGLLPDSIGEEVVPSTQTTLKDIECPVMVKATSGGKQKIVLTWGVVSKAVKYYVYAANTPFETFTKIGETSETTYTYDINPGLTRYLKVTAVNYKGIESSDSVIVKGSSLACPSISSITTDTDNNGSVTTVYWYMENVDEYIENIRYEIYCFNGNSQVDFGIVDGAQTKDCVYTFKDLPQNTNFQFQVVAYLNSAQEDSESSMMMDALTAAKQTPDAVSDLKATWATSLKSISLSFKLPEPSYIKAGNTAGTLTYEQYPLYFKVYRRLAGNTEWTSVSSHLYYDGSTTGHGIVISDSDSDADKITKAENINAWFDNYLPGTEVAFNDDDLESGKEYEYKIQSYIDHYKDINISSDILSVAQTNGHTASQPSIRTKDFEYHTITQTDSSDPENPVDTTLKTDAVLGFQMAWDSFGTERNYQFVLATTKENLNDKTDIVTVYESFDTIEDLNKSIKTFGLSKLKENGEELESDTTEEGYYSFKLYITDKSVLIDSSTEPVSALATATAPGVLLVTPAMTLPEIEEFLAVNGFHNKITLKWKTNTETNTLERYEIDDNGFAGTPEPIATTGARTEDGYTVLDTLAESGKRYVYTLTASDGNYDLPSDPVTAETLGTPNPVFDTDKVKHNSITVSWNKVQQADIYSVNFSNGIKSLGSFTFDPNAEDNTGITEKNGVYTCSINEPEGYNDASLSGKTWTATVTATNTETADTTNNDTNVFTLGPAAVTELTADVAVSKDTIKLSWKQVPGAKAYAIRRAKCEISSPYKETSVDVYTVSANGGKVKANGTDVTAAVTEVSDGKLVLTDTYKTVPTETPTSWDKNQDELAWGFPYKYTVYPLEGSEDLESDADSSEATLGNISYINANDASISKTGSCIGYGHKVTATKSEDPNTIKVTWTAPFGMNGDDEPYLWYKESGSSTWKANGTRCSKDSDGNYASFVIKPAGTDRTKAFEYAITYTSGSDTDAKPHDTYTDDLFTKKDTNHSPTEPLNKGYAFSISMTAEPVLVEGIPSFEEEFSWKLWDYSKRAVGPDESSKYSLCLKNNDFFIKSDADDGWRAIADINKDGVISTDSYTSLYGVDKYNISVTPGNNKLTVSPKTAKQYNTVLDTASSNKGVYDGLLKVQRDYKHYAKLSITRTNSANTDIETSCSDKEEYGYRNLTDGELARMALMTFAYAYYKNDGGDDDLSKMGQFTYGGGNNISAATKTNDQAGSATFTARSGATGDIGIGKYKQYVTLVNYNASLKTPANFWAITPISVSCPQTMGGIKGNADNYVYQIHTDPFTLTVTANSEDYSKYTDIFKKSFTVSATSKNELTVKCGSTEIVSTSDNGTRKWWFPMQIHSDTSYLFNSSDYGWWPKENN